MICTTCGIPRTLPLAYKTFIALCFSWCSQEKLKITKNISSLMYRKYDVKCPLKSWGFTGTVLVCDKLWNLYKWSWPLVTYYLKITTEEIEKEYLQTVCLQTIKYFFCRGQPVVFIKLKGIKNNFWFVKHNNIFYFIVILTTCFSQLTIIRSSLQELRIRCMHCK